MTQINVTSMSPIGKSEAIELDNQGGTSKSLSNSIIDEEQAGTASEPLPHSMPTNNSNKPVQFTSIGVGRQTYLQTILPISGHEVMPAHHVRLNQSKPTEQRRQGLPELRPLPSHPPAPDPVSMHSMIMNQLALHQLAMTAEYQNKLKCMSHTAYAPNPYVPNRAYKQSPHTPMSIPYFQTRTIAQTTNCHGTDATPRSATLRTLAPAPKKTPRLVVKK